MPGSETAEKWLADGNEPIFGNFMVSRRQGYGLSHNAVYPSRKRSVYLMTQRIQRHPFLGMFDGAEAAISTAQRPMTITPIQALFFMNSELVHETASTWAKHLIESQQSELARVGHAYRAAFGRPATAEELTGAVQYLLAARKTIQESGVPPAEREPQALASYLRVLLGSNEFLFVD